MPGWTMPASSSSECMHREHGVRHAAQESGAADSPAAANVPRVAALMMLAAAAELNLDVGGVSKL